MITPALRIEILASDIAFPFILYKRPLTLKNLFGV